MQKKSILFLSILVASVVVVGSAVAISGKEKRPEVLGWEISSHTSTPAILNIKIDGNQVVNYSISGSNELGEVSYPDPDSDEKNYEIIWYDILEDKGYKSNFKIHTLDLSTFGEAGRHAAVYIVVGPGADVTATTPDPEEMRQIGLDQIDWSKPSAPPVTVLETCAELLPSGDAVIEDMKKYFENADDGAMKMHYQNKLYDRETYLKKHPNFKPRCE